MRCASCRWPNSKVTDSRYSEDCSVIRRRRQCLKCKARWSTFERFDVADAALNTPLGEVVELRIKGGRRMTGRKRIAKKAANLVEILTLVPEADVDLIIMLAERIADAAAADREEHVA